MFTGLLGVAGRADRMSEALGAKDIEVADSGARRQHHRQRTTQARR